MSSSSPNNIIILGSGATGGYLAQELSIENNVTLIDKDISKINQLKNTVIKVIKIPAWILKPSNKIGILADSLNCLVSGKLKPSGLLHGPTTK